jgi:hypothetical protein
MKVYLDDVRDPKGEWLEDWVWVKTYTEAIELLKTGQVEEISLDHDLSYGFMLDSPNDGKTGYDVACWIKGAVMLGEIPIPKMYCHSMNPVGRARIGAVIKELEQMGTAMGGQRILIEDWLDMRNDVHFRAAIVYARTGRWPNGFIETLPFNVRFCGGSATDYVIRNKLLLALLNKFYPNELLG